MARRMTAAEKVDYRRLFPNLNVDNVWVLGEKTAVYNCLAWALGINNRWVWPWGGRDATSTEMRDFLRTWGFTPWVPGAMSSLAVYGTGASNVKHAVRFTNLWSSKCGQLLCITHSLRELDCGAYGSMMQEYVRMGAAVAAADDVKPAGIEIKAGEPEVQPFSAAELSVIESRVARVDAASRSAFDKAFMAWLRSWTWQQPGPPTNNEPFVDLLALGPKVIPLLVERLTDVHMWPAIYPLEFLLPRDFAVSFELDDPEVLLGEQHRARALALAWSRAQL